MIELKFKQQNPQLGEVRVVMRLIGKFIYFKFNQSQYAETIMQQMSARGAIIVQAKDWIKVNIFEGREDVKLGEVEFNLNTTPEPEIEKILSEFYVVQYLKAGFTLG